MIEIKGKYNTAEVFTDEIEKETHKQILEMCNLKELENSTIKIMPDCHAGKGCTIGTTIMMPDDAPINPFFVGVDIGCGVELMKLQGDFAFDQLDDVIRKNIPFGFSVYDRQCAQAEEFVKKLNCFDQLKNKEHLYKSLGTLGGGNHFIEVAENQEEERFLLIHSGARNLGNQVALIYGAAANKEGFLNGELRDKYLQDMRMCQAFAEANRNSIGMEIIVRLDIRGSTECTTVHNYIEMNWEMITLRKGAVSAWPDEKLVIPMNMRDGTILAKGKGNQNWNFSAPHGAGRILSRSQAKKRLEVSEFKKEMTGIFTTCISKDTLDEAPMAYKPMAQIIEHIGDTIEILDILKPVYNFKA